MYSLFRVEYKNEKRQVINLSSRWCAIRDSTACIAFACRLLPRQLIQPPADRVLLEAPLEPLADAHALTGSRPFSQNKK